MMIKLITSKYYYIINYFENVLSCICYFYPGLDQFNIYILNFILIIVLCTFLQF